MNRSILLPLQKLEKITQKNGLSKAMGFVGVHT